MCFQNALAPLDCGVRQTVNFAYGNLTFHLRERLIFSELSLILSCFEFRGAGFQYYQLIVPFEDFEETDFFVETPSATFYFPDNFDDI
jgi:hypothetical protein